VRKNFSALAQIAFILKFSGRLYFQAGKGVFLWALILNLVPSLVIVPNLYLDKLFIDTIVAHLTVPNLEWAVRNLAIIVASRFLLDTLRALANRLSGFYSRKFFFSLRRHTEIMIGTKYATIGVPTLEDPKFKDRYQKIERESLDRMVRVAENYLRLPQHLVAILSSLSIFALTQPIIILVSLASLIPSIAVDRKYIKKAFDMETSLGLLHRLRGVYSYFLNRSRAYMELRLLNIHDYLSAKIGQAWDGIINLRLSLEKGRRTAGFLAGLIDSATAYGLDLLFGIQALLGTITLGTAQAYVRAISTFKQNVTNLTVAIMELYENHLYITDLVWFLNLDSPYYTASGLKLSKYFAKSIIFEDVWFKYPDTDTWILKGVSFTVNPQENIALVGKNGAGKTTIVKLLCGFYTPTKGRILIDGHDLAGLNKPALWDKLAVLFQEFEGYNTTVRESIAAGRISKVADTAAVDHYARMTDIAAWIKSLPRGFDNPLSRDFEGGITPSTGQWQRLGLARVLFREPQLLILDEPTSNVDPEAEEEIFNQVLKYGQHKIIMFISHRFSTVRRADKILVLKGGTISESGSHDQLMRHRGLYAKLFTLQAKSYR